MGLYTGARLDEICQLDVADIVEAENPKCAIRITEDAREDAEETSGMNKRLKTKAGDRTVPIHAHLLELGFMEYVKSRPPEGKLFDVKYYAETETWAHDAGKHFSGFKTKLGFGKNKVFHSFRRTMVSALADEGVEDPKLRAIVGHEQDAVTYKVYKKSGFKPHLLNAEVQKVDWREELAAVRPWGKKEQV
jgi:integrase